MKSKEEYIEEISPFGTLYISNPKVKPMMDRYAKDLAVDILNWVTREESEYAIMYGDQPERFSTFKKDYTSEQLFEIYIESKK